MTEGDEFPRGHLVGIAANFLPVAEYEADLAVNAHARPPFVSRAHNRMAIASASLSSAGSNPRSRMAAITACLSALPLPHACFFQVPTGTP